MKRHLSQGLILMIAIAAFMAVLVYNYEQIHAQTERSVPFRKSKVLSPDVYTFTVRPDRYEAQITAYGEARARFELTLTAQVEGQVPALADHFETGRRVSKGTLLFKLEVSDYRAAITQAELDLANARLALLEEERQSAQAKAEWEASGLEGEPDSELVLLAVFLNLTVAFWVAMGLPFIFFGTLYFMGDGYLGLSLNEFTTFGFIMALGIVVDDAVVIGESIYTLRLKEGDTLDNTIKGTFKYCLTQTSRARSPLNWVTLPMILIHLPSAGGIWREFPKARAP
jgi:hypothetical protein